MSETNNNNSSGSNPENLKSDNNQFRSAEEREISLAKARGNTTNPASIAEQEKDLIDFNDSDTTDGVKVADYKNEAQSVNKNNPLPTNDSSSPKHPESSIIDTEDKTRSFAQPNSGIETQTKSFAEKRSMFEGNNPSSPPSTEHRNSISEIQSGNTQRLKEVYENQLQSNNQNSHLRSKDSGQERLYNTAAQAGQSKLKNLDDNIPLDTTTNKIRTLASRNSSLQNNNVNSIVQDPNALPKLPTEQVPFQGSQLYNNDQLGNSAASTSTVPKNLESTASQPSSLLESSNKAEDKIAFNKAEDKIALGSTNHNGILEAFQALQQLLHEILAADEKYQEWQQQNPDKTPHDFQQNPVLVKSISNETKKLLEEISRSGTANIVGSSKNTSYAQANSFANKLHDLNWHGSKDNNNQTVNNIFPGMVSTTQKVDMPFDVNGSTQHVSKVRRITIPTSLGKEGEASSAALVLLDKNGNRPPESKALYFTAHYSSNEGEEPKLTDITYPKPLQFCSDAPDSPCYVLQGNEAYFLPVNRQELQKLLKEVDLNKGIEREQVVQDKIITNSPPAQDKIITNSLQPKDQHNISFYDGTTQDPVKDNRNVNSSNVISANTNNVQQADKATSQSKNSFNVGSLREVNNIAANLQNSKVNTPSNIPGRNIKTPNKPNRTPGR